MIREGHVSFCLAAQLVAAASMHAPGAWAEFAVPAASEMVARAELALEGRFVAADGGLRFRPSKVLKGDFDSRRPLRFEAAQEIKWHSLDDFAASMTGQPCIVLADRGEGSDALTLPWAQYSIWPQGYAAHEFPSGDVKVARDFVATLAGYEASAREDVNGMISLLLNDVATDRRYAALAFLSSGLEHVIDARERRRAIVIAVGSRVMRQGDPDRWTLESISHLSPRLPAGLTVRYMLDAVDTVGDSRTAGIALSRSRAALAARKMIDRSVDPQDKRSLRAAYAANATVLRILDSKTALPLLDSPNQRIRAEGDASLRALLDRDDPTPKEPDSVDDEGVRPLRGRKYWEDRISQLETEPGR